MPKSFSSPTARLSAVVSGQASTTKAIGPQEAHERTVLAITKRIHTLTAEQRRLAAQLKANRAELRFKRRELRGVLQRDASMTWDQVALAGSPDAIDATVARAERGGR